MLVDSFLGLLVLTICGSLLLPIYIGMMQKAEYEQLKLHASQVLYSAAHFIKHNQQTSGEQVIDGQTYQWDFSQQELCVTYVFDGQEEKTCASKTKEALH